MKFELFHFATLKKKVRKNKHTQTLIRSSSVNSTTFLRICKNILQGFVSLHNIYEIIA